MRRDPFNPPPLSYLIEKDRACTSCGYNLKGLQTGDKCPECGAVIPLTAVDPRSDWVITDAGIEYLRGFGFGAILMAMCAAPMVFGVLWTLVEAPWANGLTQWPGSAACAAGIGWTLGVWIITRPRPSRDDGISSVREWRGIRWWARVSQAAWLAGVPLLMKGAFELSPHGSIAQAAANGAAASVSAMPPGQMVGGGLVLLLCAFIGLAPLALYMSRLAHWGNDTTLADRLRLVPYALGLGGFLMAVLVVMRSAVGYKGGGIATIFMGSLASVFIVLAITQFGMALISFGNLGLWSAASRTVRMGVEARRSRVILDRVEAGRARPMDVEGAVLEGFKPKRPQGKVLEKSGDAEPFELAP